MRRVVMARSARACWDALPESVRRLIESSLENLVARDGVGGDDSNVVREDDGGFRLSTMSVEVGFTVDEEVQAVRVHSVSAPAYGSASVE